MWLLFFWRRDIHLYDHAIFITYSISFMMMFLILLTLAASFGLSAAIWGTAIGIVPPLHLYKQLRHAYKLSRFGAWLRLFLLSIGISIVLTFFFVLLLHDRHDRLSPRGSFEATAATDDPAPARPAGVRSSLMMKWIVALAVATLPAPAGLAAELSDKVWNRGAADCSSNQDPAIEVFQLDPDTYVLRQNKCVHFEAPFIYVLFGDHTVFVQDTGATADAAQFPLYDTVQNLIAQRTRRPGAEPLRLLVTHSHSHGDHTAGDPQFKGKPGVTLVEPDADAVREHFNFAKWPAGSATIDLGARQLVVLPAPGHQDESIAVYDAKTGWLLTGDTVYPGMLYIRDWNTYRSSIHRLVDLRKPTGSPQSWERTSR